MITISNGEKCPYCDLIMEDNLIGGDGILTHMDNNHKNKMLDVLFPEKPYTPDEISAIEEYSDEMVKVENIHRRGYLFEKGKK